MINSGINQVTGRALAATYLDAKEAVLAEGFSDEIDWQHEVCLSLLTESVFLREAGWVVFSTGFKEAIIRQKFGDLSDAFLNWKSARSIVQRKKLCRRDALKVFCHEKKVDAVLQIAELVAEEGFGYVKDCVWKSGIDFLRELPFVGPVTAFHLAKNIGIPVVKPDRHLMRIAHTAGYNSPDELCTVISNIVGDPLPVIDLVIWRYATLDPNYLKLFHPRD